MLSLHDFVEISAIVSVMEPHEEPTDGRLIRVQVVIASVRVLRGSVRA